MFTSKDQLVRYMISGHIHLSKKDFGFFSNLVLAIEKQDQITSNQTKLVDKLICKYKRQLKKCNFDSDIITKLSWTTKVVESKKEFLQAHLFLQDGKLFLTSPFNNNFIKYFRNIDPNPFIWNKENKSYVAEYSTYAFMIAYKSVVKYFKDFTLDNDLHNAITYINQYSNLVFEPTLIKCNDNFYICPINEPLLHNLNSIDINDDGLTLFKLSQLGIKIHQDITKEDDFKNFASNYNVVFDYSKIHVLGKYLSQLGITTVVYGRGLSYSKDMAKEIKKILIEYNIEVYPSSPKPTYENVVLINVHSHNEIGYNKNITKIITLTNSKPIVVT